MKDVEYSAGFYAGVLSLPEFVDPDERDVRWFHMANNTLIGLTPIRDGESAGGARLYLRVDDLKAVGKRLLDAGAPLDADPTKERRLLAIDPDGNFLLLEEGRGMSMGMTSRTRVKGTSLFLEEVVILPGEPDQVWKAITDKAILSAWLCGGPASINAAPTGYLTLTFPHLERPHTSWNCSIKEFVPPVRLRFQEEVQLHEMTFDLAPTPDGRTLLRLTQSPVPVSALGEDPRIVARDLALSWRRILRRLQLFMEDELGEKPA